MRGFVGYGLINCSVSMGHEKLRVCELTSGDELMTVPKLDVAGSTPVARSNFLHDIAPSRVVTNLSIRVHFRST
jgi:hypothetical protein